MSKYHQVNDGLIIGEVMVTKGECGNCKMGTVVLNVHKILLPKGVEPDHRLIAFNKWKRHDFLGIGCGCYGKFHRQMAHIQDSMKRHTASTTTGTKDD